MLALGVCATAVHADMPQLRKAMDELQAAKKAPNPMPLLESAKERLTNANRGNKGGERLMALDKVKEAIARLKARDRQKMLQRIDAAIASIEQVLDGSKSN